MKEREREQVTLLDPDDVPDVVSVLCEAFYDYPVMRYVLGEEPRYESRLRTLVRFFVMARVLRGELMLGISEDRELAAAALVSRPDGRPTPQRLTDLREETWAHLGAGARARYETFGEAAGRFTVEGDHLHLNMIGVRRGQRGHGLGRLLLEDLATRSEDDPSSVGVSLTTELESNVALYEHFGYRTLGSARVGTAFTTWAMFRPDQPVARTRVAPGGL